MPEARRAELRGGAKWPRDNEQHSEKVNLRKEALSLRQKGRKSLREIMKKKSLNGEEINPSPPLPPGNRV